jgi:foldase protein PrsA
VSKTLRIIATLTGIFVALLGISACGSSGIPGNAIVSVNGTAITTSTFDHWMGIAVGSRASRSGGEAVVPVPPNYTACVAHLVKVSPKPVNGQKAPTATELKSVCEMEYKSLQTEVLGFLISSTWIIGEASSLGVNLSDAEVKREFAKIEHAQFPKASEFKKYLASSGETTSDLLLRMKVSLLSEKIQKQVVKDTGKVTQAQIAKYYEENKSKFGTPEKRNVRVILTKTEAAAASAKKEIESGESFASVARKDSLASPIPASGDLLKNVVKGEEEKALDTAIFSAKPRTLGGPVKTPFGYYVYEVVRITAGTQESLSKVQAAIKQQLISTGEQSALSKFTKDFKKKWMEKTECRVGYIVEDCKQYKAQKAAGDADTEG